MDSAPASARLLPIDDDAELCALLARFLAGENVEVETANDPAWGVERALSGDHALILLDVMMPLLNGFEVLGRVRARSRIPVLMLTAKGDTLDRVLGLNLGADDYLAKPFEPSELAARIRAILRRSAPASHAARGGHLKIADVEVDFGARSVRRNGQLLELTSVEFDLLAALMSSGGAVVSRENLMRNVLGRNFSPFDRSIDTHIYNLRKKIGALPDGTERIKGIRGAGYLYALPGGRAHA
jgi:two-component system, OmpR family, response regulator CpxR